MFYPDLVWNLDCQDSCIFLGVLLVFLQGGRVEELNLAPHFATVEFPFFFNTTRHAKTIDLRGKNWNPGDTGKKNK